MGKERRDTYLLVIAHREAGSKGGPLLAVVGPPSPSLLEGGAHPTTPELEVTPSMHRRPRIKEGEGEWESLSHQPNHCRRHLCSSPHHCLGLRRKQQPGEGEGGCCHMLRRMGGESGRVRAKR